MKKILITGISGFAGSFLAEYLLSQQGYRIFGTYHSTKPTLSNQSTVTLEQVDLNNVSAVQALVRKVSPDVIFHLAAMTSPAESFDDPTKTIITNVVTEINLLEAVRESDLLHARIIIVSSADVYGIVDPKDLPIDEETQFRPGNPYAVSKITQDYLGLQYFLAYKMDIVRVRPFNHIGPRQASKFAVASFARQIAEIEKEKKEPVIKVGNLDAEKDFTDVRDMVRAYTFLIDSGIAGEVYNIGTGKAYRIGELLEKLVSLAKVPITIQKDESLLRPSDTPLLVCDNTKFVKETGWKPEISIDETLKSTLDYWRSVV